MSSNYDLSITKGKTFSLQVRVSTSVYTYKPITAISQTAPASITSAAHGIPDGWRVAVVSVKGMTQINAINNPPRTNEYKKATVTGANTITLNAVNSAGYSPYTSGGYLQFLTPMDLAGYTARMSIKDRVGGTELLRLDTSNSRIVIDNSNKTLTLTIESAATAAITWTDGVYDLETLAPAVSATLLVAGKQYVIAAVGSTNFMLVGATANTVGVSFTATGAGTGSGTVEGVVDLVLAGSVSVSTEVTTT